MHNACSQSVTWEWKLLFRQTHPHYLTPATKWLSVNPTDPTNDNYSILNTLGDECKNENGKFLFHLKWPKASGGGNNYNKWRQSTNPVTEKVKVVGYEAVDVHHTGSHWGGLENSFLHRGSSPHALLDGSVNSGITHATSRLTLARSPSEAYYI